VTFSRKKWRISAFRCLLLLVAWPLYAQDAAQKPPVAPEKAAEVQKKSEEPQLPFQIQLLETHIRFEPNGDSRKEVHTIVKLNNILGARQFSRLNFDYNRSFQQIEIPLVRVSHANGGTSELLPSAATDAPNSAVEKFPAYQDVRVKSVRILGLQEGDTIEYRVITTTTHHPLAPDFWLEHTFDRSGQVLEEHYELNLPSEVKPKIGADSPATSVREEQDARSIYQWQRTAPETREEEVATREPDIQLTSFSDWKSLSSRLAELLQPPQASTGGRTISPEVKAKAIELTKNAPGCSEKLRVVYDFVSQKIATVDLPLGSTAFRTRSDSDILTSGYATPEDKYKLFAALAHSFSFQQTAFLTSALESAENQPPRPSLFNHVLIKAGCEAAGPKKRNNSYWLDPSMEVAPFGVVASNFRGKKALGSDNLDSEDHSASHWVLIPSNLPFPSTQKVSVSAALNPNGELTAKVKYTLRGDNELLLRVAFHQTSKDKWKEVANLLAISDGFRGQVTGVDASDPMTTKDPFTVEYEISQPKFVDWSKKPVRIPALLPQIGLPDPPPRGATAQKIELGTPLDVDTRLTLHLPAGTTIQAPAGTSVQRDYATFSSQYSAKLNVLTAARHANFLAREIPGDRAADYNAFLRAVQNDQSQLFTLVPAATPSVQPLAPPQKQKSSP
jgi:hypothetical protein